MKNIVGVRLIRAGRLQELLDAAAAGEVDAAEAAQWEERYNQEAARSADLDRTIDLNDEQLDDLSERIEAVTEARDEALAQHQDAEDRARFLREDLGHRREQVAELEAEVDTLTKQLQDERRRAAELVAQLELVRGAAADVDLVVLLHHGKYHSAHIGAEAAKAAAEAEGAPPWGWAGLETLSFAEYTQPRAPWQYVLYRVGGA
ncbi:hypothetical protein ACWC9S_27155 [Streptomyces xiamenensis]